MNRSSRWRAALALVLGLVWLPVSEAQTETQDVESTSARVYVIPIDGAIQPSTANIIARGIQEAKDQGATHIILDMDTPGGRVDATMEIMRGLIGLTNITTFTYVNQWAISAGSFISFSTDRIYMAPQSQIGAAAPVVGGPSGAQDMPETMKEKSVSAISALVRSATEAKGHNARLAESMIRMEIEYEIDGEIISREGELLTLTDTEAAREYGDPPTPLLSSGTVDSIDAILAAEGIADAEVIRLEYSYAERLARLVQLLPFIFMTGGLLALYLEIRTPGFGVAGITGALLLAVWFWANHVAGLAGAGEILVFILGVALIALEIFVIPGFGVAGIAGLLMVLGAMVMAMVPHIPTEEWWQPALPSATQLHMPLRQMAYTMVLTGTLIAGLGRLLPKTPLFKRLALEATADAEAGYTSAPERSELLGMAGTAITSLHPAGAADFNGERIDVIARGEFIDANQKIRVAEVHGNRVVVDRA